MVMFKRSLTINLPKGKSAFLWGARKTGKSTYLKLKFPKSIRYDFLKTDTYFSLSKQPSLLREHLLSETNKEKLKFPIIIDEVQKIPPILDEVHWLIENKGLSFILCGSSARKLKRGHANLLGGRAWRFEMFPLTSKEIGNIDLLKALNSGSIPTHYQEKQYRKSLKSYVQDYLKEEIMEEGLTRNVPAFARFLDSLGYSHGELTNFSNIARDCGVDSKTVREYYQILVDTLLGTFIEPFEKRTSRQTIRSTSKFYLFDVGIAGILSKRVIQEERGILFGRAFEHFILMELLAHRAYTELDYNIKFWRTKTGLEVDFILGEGAIALEVKGTNRVDKTELKSIKTFKDEYNPRKSIIVSNENTPRLCEGIEILPWRNFLEMLWDGRLLV